MSTKKMALVRIAAIVLAIFGLTAVQAHAQSTSTFTASVTVGSTLSISENTPLSFGQLVLLDDGTNDSTATLAGDGTFTDNSAGTSAVVQLGTPTPGNYTVATGASVFSNIVVTFPASTTLANASAAPSNGSFTVDTFTIDTPDAGSMTGTTTTVAACNTAIATGGDCDFLTDGNGEITLPVGADITATSGDSFIDGTYSGNFDLVAAFN